MKCIHTYTELSEVHYVNAFLIYCGSVGNVVNKSFKMTTFSEVKSHKAIRLEKIEHGKHADSSFSLKTAMT